MYDKIFKYIQCIFMNHHKNHYKIHYLYKHKGRRIFTRNDIKYKYESSS